MVGELRRVLVGLGGLKIIVTHIGGGGGGEKDYRSKGGGGGDSLAPCC